MGFYGWPVTGHRDGSGIAPLEAGVQDVLREVDEDRPGPARAGQVEGLRDHLRDLFGFSDEVVVLGGRHGDAGGVCLLESVVADRVGRDLSGNGDDRHGVHQRVGQGRDQIGRTGTGCCDRNADLAGGPGVAFCHVPCALLVTGQDVAEPGVQQWIVGGEDGAAGDAEGHVDFLVLESLDQCLCTGDTAHLVSLRAGGGE